MKQYKEKLLKEFVRESTGQIFRIFCDGGRHFARWKDSGQQVAGLKIDCNCKGA